MKPTVEEVQTVVKGISICATIEVELKQTHWTERRPDWGEEPMSDTEVVDANVLDIAFYDETGDEAKIGPDFRKLCEEIVAKEAINQALLST